VTTPAAIAGMVEYPRIFYSAAAAGLGLLVLAIAMFCHGLPTRGHFALAIAMFCHGLPTRGHFAARVAS
jgi:hypothetical protein